MWTGLWGTFVTWHGSGSFLPVHLGASCQEQLWNGIWDQTAFRSLLETVHKQSTQPWKKGIYITHGHINLHLPGIHLSGEYDGVVAQWEKRVVTCPLIGARCRHALKHHSTHPYAQQLFVYRIKTKGMFVVLRDVFLFLFSLQNCGYEMISSKIPVKIC